MSHPSRHKVICPGPAPASCYLPLCSKEDLEKRLGIDVIRKSLICARPLGETTGEQLPKSPAARDVWVIVSMYLLY